MRDHIATAEKSVVRVLLGGKALVTVRELSSLTIKEETGPLHRRSHVGQDRDGRRCGSGCGPAR